MGAEMINRDIKDFTTVSSVEPSDYVVLSLFKGTSGKVSVGLFRSAVAKGIMPSISSDGYWLIGDEDTRVQAKGMTPEFRKGAVAIEWKYTTEEDSAWRPLMGFSELKMKYEDLTEDEIAGLKLQYSDLTEEEIFELQKPAAEMITVLERTDSEVRAAESARVDAESVRVENENLRQSGEQGRRDAETVRQEAETFREQSESERVSAESDRASEFARLKTESETASQYATTQGDYAMEQGDYAKSQGDFAEKYVSEIGDYKSRIEVLEQKDVVLPEEEYSQLQDAGALDDTKFYFVYEE